MRLLRAVAWVVGCLVGLLLLVCVLLYVPPVQRWAVRTACRAASEATGMDIRVGELRLWFPLTLHVGDVLVVSEGDTLADIGRVDVGVRLLPLFTGHVVVDELLVEEAKVNTLSLIESLQLSGSIGSLRVEGTSVALGEGSVEVPDILLSSADLTLVLPDSVPEEEEEEGEPLEWVVALERITLDSVGFHLRMPEDLGVDVLLGQGSLGGTLDLETSTYTFANIKAEGSQLGLDLNADTIADGLDFSHLRFSGVALEVPHVQYNGDGSLVVQIDSFAGAERSGLTLTDVDGEVLMDSVSLTLNDFSLVTTESDALLQFRMDMDAFSLPTEEEPDIVPGQFSVHVSGHFGKGDIAIASGVPLLADILPGDRQVAATMTAEGNLLQLSVPSLMAYLPGCLSVEGEAELTNVTDTLGAMTLDAVLHAESENLDFVKSAAGDAADSFILPYGMTLSSELHMAGSDLSAVAQLSTSHGSAHVEAEYGMAAERYKAAVTTRELLVNQFLPLTDTIRLTTDIIAEGHGFDFFSSRTEAQADIRIAEGCYGAFVLDSVALQAVLAGGDLQAQLSADNPQMQFAAEASSHLPGDTLNAALSLDIRHVDLYTMGLTASPFSIDEQTLTLDFRSADSLTQLTAQTGDFEADFHAECHLLDITAQFADMVTDMSEQISRHELNPATLKAYLPSAKLQLQAGTDNAVAELLTLNGISFESIGADMLLSPEMGVGGRALVQSLSMDGLLVDTIFVGLKQDSAQFDFHVTAACPEQETIPGFHASLDGYLATRSADVHIIYDNLQGERGIDLGLHANVGADSTLTATLYPEEPVLAYRRFALNTDNYITLSPGNSLSADVELTSLEDSCYISVEAHPEGEMVQDIQLVVQRLDLSQLLTLVPDMPNMGGLINIDAGYHATAEHFWVTGTGGVDGLTLDASPLGDVGSEFAYRPQGTNTHEVMASLTHNGSEVAHLAGSYTDSLAGRLDAELSLTALPLALLNPMLSEQMIRLEGQLGGNLSVHGPMDGLVINGQLLPDSMAATYELYSLGVRFADEPLTITDSRITFERYKVYGSGEEPMTIDGWCDFADFSAISMDLSLGGKNVQLVDAQKTSKSVLYGTLLGDLFVKVSGPLSDLSVRGLIRLLQASNVTYVMADTPLTIEDRLSDIVTFVDFTAPPDTTLEEVRSLLALDMQISVEVEEGATLRAEFSADKQSYVEVQGSGTLQLNSTPEGVMSLLGKYTISDGVMKYALPVIPLKTFEIGQGSYVEFTGEPMNPTLSFKAWEETKAMVSDDSGNRRSVRFLSGLTVSGTLENMELAFTLEAPEDLTVQNELAGMSAEEKNKLAVGLLCTGMYLSSSNSNGISANNALNNYLQSEINNIAGKALATTVDVELGMDQSTNDDGSTRTDYSFKFSKRFFSDRLSVVVGGKVSDGSSASGQSGTYIDNVSLEWRLNTAGTRYVKIYHEENYDNLIEGELTENGVSFVYKKKMDSLSELYFWKR